MPGGAMAPSLTPLHMAAIAGKARVVCLVLDCACAGGSTQGDQKYIDVASSVTQATPLHKACEVGSLDTVRILLAHDARYGCR